MWAAASEPKGVEEMDPKLLLEEEVGSEEVDESEEVEV